MRVISMILSDREIARIEENGKFTQMVEFKGAVQPSVRQLVVRTLSDEVPAVEN